MYAAIIALGKIIIAQLLHNSVLLQGIYRIAGIFRGGKFSRKPLQLYYSNYSRAEFSRNAPSSAKNYPFCTELTVRAALCNHTLARHLFAG